MGSFAAQQYVLDHSREILELLRLLPPATAPSRAPAGIASGEAKMVTMGYAGRSSAENPHKAQAFIDVLQAAELLLPGPATKPDSA
jgi:hypothetical protein